MQVIVYYNILILNLLLPIVINGKEYSSLHNVLNDQNGYISRDLAEFLAAVVDNAKDPNAFKGNINTYTADVLATMIRVGVPMQEAIALLRQPIIVKLSQLYYKYGETLLLKMQL